MPVSPRKSIGRKRFVSLIKHLETLKDPDSFDYSHWGLGEVVRRNKKVKTFTDPNGLMGYGDHVGDYKIAETNVHGTCGTSGCVLGHAAFMPEFRKLGLRLVALLTTYDIEYVEKTQRGERPTFGADVVLVDRKGAVVVNSVTEIAEKIFGLSDTRTEEIFFPGGSAPSEEASAKEVAKYLRQQVKEIDANEGWSI